MTHFGNSVPLKSRRSHLDNPSYLVGYILAKNKEVIMYTWEIMDLISIQRKWTYIGKCITLKIFSGFRQIDVRKLQVNSNLGNYGLRYYEDKIGISVLALRPCQVV